jgi:hypothetical protein
MDRSYEPEDTAATVEPLRQAKRDVRAVLVVCLICSWLIAFASVSFPDPQGTDLYPVWWCSSALLDGRSPYDPQVARGLRESWEVAQRGVNVAAVCAYPLPFYLVMSPLALGSLPVALVVWCLPLLIYPPVMGMVAPVQRRMSAALLPFAFYPVFHAATLKTSSLLWNILPALLLVALRTGRNGIAGALLALFPAKPQSAALFSVWALPHTLRTTVGRRSFAAGVFLLWILPTLLWPSWPSEWIGTLRSYANDASLASIFPPLLLTATALVAALLCARRSTFAAAALLQMLLFPINDLYCGLPLLYVWLLVPPSVALPGVACSWLIPLVYEHPNNLEALITFILLPLLAALGVDAVRRSQRHPAPGPLATPR